MESCWSRSAETPRSDPWGWISEWSKSWDRQERGRCDKAHFWKCSPNEELQLGAC